jgi:flagellar biosynthesis/type III secretory pathway M-ring protein FliF/YscJ
MIPEGAFSSSAALLIGFSVLALIAIAGGFAILRQFRADLAKELKAQIDENAEAQKVDIQQPFETRLAVRMATHEELKNIECRVEHLEQRDGERLQMLIKAMAELDNKNEERASKTHERINLLLGAVSEMRGEIKRLPCSKGQPCPT